MKSSYISKSKKKKLLISRNLSILRHVVEMSVKKLLRTQVQVLNGVFKCFTQDKDLIQKHVQKTGSGEVQTS